MNQVFPKEKKLPDIIKYKNNSNKKNSEVNDSSKIDKLNSKQLIKPKISLRINFSDFKSVEVRNKLVQLIPNTTKSTQASGSMANFFSSTFSQREKSTANELPEASMNKNKIPELNPNMKNLKLKKEISSKSNSKNKFKAKKNYLINRIHEFPSTLQIHSKLDFDALNDVVYKTIDRKSTIASEVIGNIYQQSEQELEEEMNDIVKDQHLSRRCQMLKNLFYRHLLKYNIQKESLRFEPYKVPEITNKLSKNKNSKKANNLLGMVANEKEKYYSINNPDIAKIGELNENNDEIEGLEHYLKNKIIFFEHNYIVSDKIKNIINQLQ